jgi:hypothetical protein
VGLVLLLCAACAGLFLGGIVFLAWMFHDPDGEPKAACETHLRSIATALEMYHQDHKCFPPAWVADAQGRPMHSWRVLILPDLGEDDLFKEYNLDEPWDGPNNRKLAHRIPEVYRCPSDPSSYDGQTSYVAVVGPQASWLGSTPVKLSELSTPSQALHVIEVYESGINWLEPRDFTAAGLDTQVNAASPEAIRSLHLGGAHALYADAEVKFLSDDTSPADVQASLNAPRIPIAKSVEKTDEPAKATPAKVEVEKSE